MSGRRPASRPLAEVRRPAMCGSHRAASAWARCVPGVRCAGAVAKFGVFAKGDGRMTDSFSVTYVAEPDRYEQMTYRRCGMSGIDLPLISLGLWQNFGYDTPLATQRAIIRRAFDLGVTHFDLANNYGGTAPGQTLRKGDHARRMARPRRTSAGSWPRTCGPTGMNC